jgi:hypothetical protein
MWESRAQIARTYDALKDGEGNRYSRSLPAGNDLGVKEQFLDDVGVTRVTVTQYRKLAAHTERLTELWGRDVTGCHRIVTVGTRDTCCIYPRVISSYFLRLDGTSMLVSFNKLCYYVK